MIPLPAGDLVPRGAPFPDRMTDMTTTGGWADLSSRAKFSLRGPDRTRYLNGQVTNNVARLRPGGTCQALVCTHKGKLEGELFIRAEEDRFLMDAPEELRESLFARLGKYLIADDCELEDVTDAFRLWHEFPVPLAEDAPEAGRVHRFGPPGRDVWQPVGAPPVAPAPGFLSADELERLRVEHGVPRWGADLTPDVFPQEARLEDRAVDFHKGCYVGQEIVSRLRSVGHVNRLLVALEAGSEVGAEALAGGKLFTAEGDKEAGRLTSVVWSPERGRWLALGYVKRALLVPDAVFLSAEAEGGPRARWRLREGSAGA